MLLVLQQPMSNPTPTWHHQGLQLVPLPMTWDERQQHGPPSPQGSGTTLAAGAFFVGFCYVLKQTERKSGMPCMLQWRWVSLPRYYKEQVWEGSSKARGEKKMSRVKSARENKGEDTAEKVRGETIDLAAFEYVTAAGSWQQDFEKHSLTNAPLWQMPDVSHHFPAFQFMVCWHTQESYFSTEGQLGPRMPVHIGLPSAGAARAQCPLASRELYHAGLQFATWIPDKNCLLRKVFEEAFIRAFQASYTKSNTIKSADGFFNTRQMLEACCTSLLQPRCWPRDFHVMLQHQLHL